MAFIVKREVISAPSGIPASTAIFLIVANADLFDSSYSKSQENLWDNAGDLVLEFLDTAWRFRHTYTNAELNNTSSDANYIPTTGWTQNGSPIAITITAA